MGTDNIFHKKRAKKAADIKRKRAKRSPYDKVLIVCEGRKTEPNYFNELIKFHKLNSANVKVTGESGSSPSSVWRLARQMYQDEKSLGDSFDRVYCVFDKDSHSCYERTCSAIAKCNPPDTFHATTSVPCFEYWLLLHYTFTTKPYYGTPHRSSGAQVLDELKKYDRNYTKGQDNTFHNLESQLPYAKAGAQRSLKAAKSNQTDNPSTYIHELVSYLESLNRNT